MKLPLVNGAEILHGQNGIYAINKPEGIRSHPNKDGIDPSSLVGLPYHLDEECYFFENGVKWFLLNRLDAPTSGILLLSDNYEVANLVKAAFAERQVEKKYIALVYGRMMRSKEFWKDRIVVKKTKGQLRSETGGGAEAITEVERLKGASGNSPFSLLRLNPKTGRTHQLRVQCAKRRLPIIGDATYGDFSLNRRLAKSHGFKRLFLHSQEIRFSIMMNGSKISFSAKAPTPPEFEAALVMK